MKLLTAFYDMDHGPVSYDFVTWLVRAMFERDERGCTDLHVVIVPNSATGFARKWGKHDEAATRWRLWHIVLPACQLASATVSLAPDRQWAIYIKGETLETWWPEGKAHFMAPLVDAARAGKKIPKLRATEQAKRYAEQWFKGKPIITVTLRDQETDSQRNSNIKAFESFQKQVLAQRQIVCMTLHETNKILAFHACPAWVADIDLRLALYERAEMNIIGNNGPQEMLKFSDAPYLAFGQGLGTMGADHWREYFHMELGEQVPWAAWNQKLVFKPDSFEIMKKEFEAWEARSGDR